MFSKRATDLLNILLSANKAITGSVLANELSISNRTIRSDIAQINVILKDFAVRINAHNANGYYINEEDKTTIYDLINHKATKVDNFPITPSERMLYILIALLFKNDYLSMNDLAETLYISKTTVHIDIKKLIVFLSEKNSKVTIVLNNQGVLLIGEEKAKRLLVINYFKQYENSIALLNKILGFYFNDLLIQDTTFELYHSIIQVMEHFAIYLTDKEVLSLVILFTISSKRIKTNNELKTINPDYSIQEIVMKLVSKATTIFKIGFSNKEVAFIQENFESKRLVKISNSIDDNDFVHSIIDKFLIKVNAIYAFDFTNNYTLRQFLYLHIKPMLKRLENQQYEENPLKDEIKRKFPLAIEIAMVLVNNISEDFNFIMNDSEISYVALHIASALEVYITPAEILIVTDLGSGTQQLILSKLTNHFMNKIVIIDTLTIYQFNSLIKDHKLPSCDVIVSTSLLVNNIAIPIVKVNPLLFREDISNIKHYINYYSTQIKGKDQFTNLFNKNLFTYDEFDNYYEAIYQMVIKFKEYNFIDDIEKFFRSVIIREEAFSTIMDNGIAIPHASENIANKTIIGIIILKKAILHKSKNVSVILLNALNEQENLQPLYVAIEKVLEIENMAIFNTCTTFLDFEKILTGGK